MSNPNTHAVTFTAGAVRYLLAVLPRVQAEDLARHLAGAGLAPTVQPVADLQRRIGDPFECGHPLCVRAVRVALEWDAAGRGESQPPQEPRPTAGPH